VHRACGDANEIEVTAIQKNIDGLLFFALRPTDSRDVRLATEEDDPLLGDDDWDIEVDVDEALVPAGRVSVNFSAKRPARVRPLRQLASALAPADWDSFRRMRWYWQLVAVIRTPIHVALTLTIPVVDPAAPDKHWRRLLATVQVLLAPVFVVWGFEVHELDLVRTRGPGILNLHD